MSDYNFEQPSFRREIRLGLVVCGGVALAVYMNGVCSEFYNCVRGRGIYKLLKACTDSDIVVDIISGTSAGGINGVLLSYALTNSNPTEVVEFANFAEIWRESADILKLLRDPSSSNTNIESVLNGEGYYQTQLQDVFEKAYINKRGVPQGEWVSDFNELDLFVTGTDILGQIYKAFDETGCVIEIKNHRAVFQLKHRRGRKEPFNPKWESTSLQSINEDTYQALAKLCRITSCFPIAFPVVEVDLKENQAVEQTLVEWGQLDKRELAEHLPTQEYKLYFVDGGVLDNRPFSYTIKEIYYRTANCPVDRKLFYIDPCPDRFTDNLKFQKMGKPNTLQIIQDCLVGIPMYESIGNDLEAIKAHNEKVRRYKSLLADAEAPANSPDVSSDAIDIKEAIYLQSRLISMRDRVLPLVLRMEKDFRGDAQKQAYLEKAASLLTESLNQEKEKDKRDKIRQAFGEQIRDLDVEYALRKHFYLLQNICQRLETEQSPDEYKKLSMLSEAISRQVKLLEIIREALNQLLSHPKISDSFYQFLAQTQQNNQVRGLFYERLLRLHRFLLDARGLEPFCPDNNSNLEAIPSGIFQSLPLQARDLSYSRWLSQKRISSIFAQLKQKIENLTTQGELEETIWQNPTFNYTDSQNEVFITLLQQVEQASEALIETSQLEMREELLKRFKNFRYLDQLLYPFEYLMDLTEKAQIQTIRISPSDANLGLGEGKTVEDKLAGDTLYAFGGFFKKSWRSNDILWGRLDGLNRIFSALLTPESVKRFPEFLERQSNTFKGTPEFEVFVKQYLEFLLDESLPNAQDNSRQKITDYLNQLVYPEKLPEKQLKSTVEQLVRILVLEGHREIINTDLPSILEDQIAEQLNWNQQRVKPNNQRRKKALVSYTPQLEAEEKPQYLPVSGYFDRSVSALAAAQLAQEAISTIAQANTEKFFREKYNVGKETVWGSIPRTILATISTRFALNVRNIILTTLGKRSSILRRSLTYNILDKSLQLLDWWLQFTGPLAMQPSNYQPIFLFVQLVLLLLAIAAVAIALFKVWVWVMLAVGATLLFWLLELIRRTSSTKR